MSEDPSYGTFSQFGDSPETQTIPPISSFAKRNSRLSTSPGSEECSQTRGFYRELTLEGMEQPVTVPNTNQQPSSQEVMQQSSQPQQHQQQQQQNENQAGPAQQYAKAVAAAVAAAYQAQAQEIGNLTATTMVSMAGSVSGSVISHSQPQTSGTASVNMVSSPPPLMPMPVTNSSLLGQALQAADDMGGLPALQLAVQHHQQLQQQQHQLLHAVQTVHTQNAVQKMMPTSTPTEQPLQGHETSPTVEAEQGEGDKAALVSLMPASSLASPMTLNRVNPSNIHTMTPSSQLQTSSSNQLTTYTTASSMPENVYSMAAVAPMASTNMSAGMMASNQVSNLNMGITPHFIQLNNSQLPMPVPQMLIQNPASTNQEIIPTDQSMMAAQGMQPNVTNNNDLDMMNNMPDQLSTAASKRRNSKKPVPNDEKDEKYFERRNRNNMAAKRSRDSRKRREDQVSMRANFLQKENDILRAQLATLRQEANSLRQLLSQQRPVMPAQMSMQMPVQMMPKNMSQ